MDTQRELIDAARAVLAGKQLERMPDHLSYPVRVYALKRLERAMNAAAEAEREEAMSEYRCKQCSIPWERAIAGELICENCWNWSQMNDEERAQADEITRQLASMTRHCALCDAAIQTGELCAECAKDNEPFCSGKWPDPPRGEGTR